MTWSPSLWDLKAAQALAASGFPLAVYTAGSFILGKFPWTGSCNEIVEARQDGLGVVSIDSEDAVYIDSSSPSREESLYSISTKVITHMVLWFLKWWPHD